MNSENHGFGACAVLANLPLEKVVQIHVAGHERRGALCIGTHAGPIIRDVYTLLEWTLARMKPVPLLLERDNNFGDWKSIRQEVYGINSILMCPRGASSSDDGGVYACGDSTIHRV